MMQIFKKVEMLNSWRNEINTSLGLVPTMGNLHEGHLSLVRKSLAENKHTIVTIFVNPKQFSPDEDFDKYPRTLEEDIKKLSSLITDKDQDKLCLFAPQNDSEIYPIGHSHQITIEGPMTKVLCGAHRDGHFNGVTTVVYRLFELIKPSIAYFGEKDFQQLTIIKEMVRQKNLSVKISSHPIVRDDSGLALSSRNQYLSANEIDSALTLSRTLKKLADDLKSENYPEIEIAKNHILKKDSQWQYLEILDSENLLKPTDNTKKVVIAGAYLVGKTRLIDNILLNYT